MAALRYGMKAASIRYWQGQARELRSRTDIVRGEGTLRRMSDEISPRVIGHEAICAAAVLAPAKLKALLDDRTELVAARLGIDTTRHPVSSATVNRLLKALGHSEKLVAGRGYLYFVDGDASSWYSSSVPVCYLRDLTVGRWVQEHAELKARGAR